MHFNIVTDFCDYCLVENLKATEATAHREHPDWFTSKRKSLKRRCTLLYLQWQQDHVKPLVKQRCFRYDSECAHCHSQLQICGNHIEAILKGLITHAA